MMVSGSVPTPFRLRPLALAELLDETFRIYRRDFGLFAGLALCVTVPGVLMDLIGGSYRSIGWMTKFLKSTGNPDAMHALAQSPPPQSDPVVSLLASIIRLILIPLTIGVIVYAANELIHGRATTVVDALEGTLRRYWGLAGLAVLLGLVFFCAVLIITLPVVFLVLVRWGVGIPALFEERLGPRAALGRSWRLVEGYWWRTLGIFVVVGVMTWIASAILQATGGFIVGLVPGLSDDLRGALVVVVGSLAGALVMPISYIAVTLMYYDLRVRHDGVDLDQLAQQAQPPSAA